MNRTLFITDIKATSPSPINSRIKSGATSPVCNIVVRELGPNDLKIHWPDPDIDIEQGWSTLSELKREGKVRYIGVSNFNVAQLQRAMKIDRVDSLQPPYSLIHPGVDHEILPFCERNGIDVIVYSPMMSGLLSGRIVRERVNDFPDDDWRKHSLEFQEPRLYRNLWLAELLKNIGRHHGLSAGEIAIAWTLRLSAVTGAIVGGRSPDQVDGIVGAANFG